MAETSEIPIVEQSVDKNLQNCVIKTETIQNGHIEDTQHTIESKTEVIIEPEPPTQPNTEHETIPDTPQDETEFEIITEQHLTKAIQIIKVNETITEIDEGNNSVKTDDVEIQNEQTVTKDSTIVAVDDTVRTQTTKVPQIVRWERTKTVLFVFFLLLFFIWIAAYYAFDKGLIPFLKDK